MPARNSLKTYSSDTFYHLYNRGVEKRTIFQDQQDFSVFLSYLRDYLSPKNESHLREIIASPNTNNKDKDRAIKYMLLKNYSGLIDLVCYALMPNHFHLLVLQHKPSINRFMNSLNTRYGMYFNRKYNRTGALFQDVYKAVAIESDEQLLHLSKYIHLNPIKLNHLKPSEWEKVILPFSLPEFLGTRNTNWIKPKHILEYFSKSNPNASYESFMEIPIDEILIANPAIDFDQDII